MGRSKLSEQDKDEIRKLAKEGNSRASLAARYNVSEMTIHRVLNPEYYAKTLARAAEYQRENADRVQKQRACSRRDFNVSLSIEKDAAIIEQLDKQDNVTDYIRTLVSDDITKDNQKK